MAHRTLPAARWLRTVRYLRGEQIAGLLREALRRDVQPRHARGGAPRFCLAAPAVPFLPPASHAQADVGGRVRLLNREARLAPPLDWDFSGEGPLWSYHLHQMDWVRAPQLPPEHRLRVLLDWIESHRSGTGWRGGPISLRAFAWTKLLASAGALPAGNPERERIARSLADQLATLAAHQERRLLGNHYLWNLLALVLGGIVLDGSESERWLAHDAPLARELDEQVGGDGAHCERSPMYHALILENVLDLLNAARALPERAPRDLAARLSGKAAAMLGALRVFTHPDGEIALVGDAAFGIAARSAELEAYGTALGVSPRGPEREGVLAEAGFVRLAQGPFSLLASVSGPRPPHQPGHAHGDALAFELVVGRERVVTDTGVTEYLPGVARDASRATASHATLQIDGCEQAEFWGAHRVGGRPDVALLAVEPGRRAEAVCAGWATPEHLHRRVFAVEPDEVRIDDSLSGPERPVSLHLPLGPGVEPRLAGERASLRLPSGAELAVELPAGVRWRVARTPYFPEFGRREERAALLGEAPRFSSGRWRFRLP